ncbi:AIPR family protein [Klebsiella quasipneumoniae]|uniref:AIPR family protein n=1 Tax=Klebsiella quasipneumoniae TaxID=1463165 RepID=UPI00352A3AE4
MAALEPHYMTILKKVLTERFVPSLPPLLDTSKPLATQQAKQLSRAFSAFALHKLLGITPQLAVASVVDDFNDKGIDAIHYDTESETLYLLQTKLKESEQFKQEDALPFCEGVRLLLRQDFASFNANVQNRKADIETALDTCSHIKLVIPYTGEGVSQTANTILQSLLDDGDLDEERLHNQVLYYSATDIIRDLLAEQAYQPVHTDILLHKHEKVESPRTTYYGIALLKDLVALYQDHGKALYERNIRYFLGSSKSEVNKAIKNTLYEAPGDFFYLNNGVTAVCDVIEAKATKNGAKKLKVRGLSIINGAQTVASAAEFVSQHPNKSIEEAKVMLTLIKAPADGKFGKRVTKARNNQNPVQVTNFTSLDENQERLRQEIAHIGYIYHYRAEMVLAGEKMITLDEALKALAALQNDPRYTVWLKSGPLRLADSESAEYQVLFPIALTGTVLVNAVLCHRAIRSLVVGYEQNAVVRSPEKLLYRHAVHVITTVMMKRLLQKIREPAVMNAATLPALISRPLDQLRQEAVNLAIDPRTRRLTLAEGPLAYFQKMERTIPFLIDLMKKHYDLNRFQPETSPHRLHILAAEKKSLEHDLAERLAKAAPQL